MYTKENEWPQEDIDRLIAAWRAGHTVAMIENALGRSKNAVCGKVWRLCAKGVLIGRPNPSRPRPESASQAPKKLRHQDRVPTLPSLPPPMQLPVMEPHAPAAEAAPALPEKLVPDTAAFDAAVNGILVAPGFARPEFKPRKAKACCWPRWGNHQAPTHDYCDDTAIEGRPYCPLHAGRAFVKIRDRQEAAA